MPTYRYLLCDLLTDRLVASLPLSGVSFERRISRSGALSAGLSAVNAETIALAKACRDYAGRSALWVYRDRQLWWGGVLWSAVPSLSARDGLGVALSAATFDSYAHKRELHADQTFAGVDAANVQAALWAAIQADPSGNIGVATDITPVGLPMTVTYPATDTTKVGQIIENIGDQQSGPEHTVDTYDDGTGVRVKRFRTAPKLNVVAGQVPSVVFVGGTRAGRVIEWQESYDATEGGTSFLVRGDAVSNVPTLSSRLTASELLAAGWPLLDVSEDRSGTTDPAVLNQYAGALRDSHAGQVVASGYTVQVGETGWNPNRIGEPVRIKLRDLWHTDNTVGDVTVRPVGVQVTPGERGTPETVKLLLGDD